MQKLVLVGFLLGALMGCSETHNYYFTGCGEGGVLHSGDYGVACSYVVVVTGFECPSGVPHHSEFEGGHVCSAEPIDPAELPREICTAFNGKCQPVTTPDSGTPIDASIDGGPVVDASIGCESTADCTEGEYCKGDCSGPGACTDIPEDVPCTEAEEPYCTCEGVAAINNNGCVWERYTPGDNSCRNTGGACLQNSDCPNTQYCAGGCSEPGICTDFPSEDLACAGAAVAICNCDGEVVEGQSGCNFQRHETAESDASCMAAIELSCLNNEQCKEGEYCKGDCSGRGTCTIIPEEACPPSAPFYCSCDGQSRQSNSACIYDRYDPATVDTEECMPL